MAPTDLYPTPNGTIWGMDSYMSYIVSVEPLFFLVLLGVIWIIVFVASKNYSTSRAFTFASFVTFILSVPIALLGWLANIYPVLFAIAMAAGMIWIRVGDSYY